MEDFINIPKTKRGQETLNRILNASVQVFYEKGYHGTSINDIVSLAGVASGTFYIYFDSKYSLYKFLLLQCSHKVRKDMSVATAQCETRREKEQEGLRAWLKFIKKHKYIYHIIWEALYVDNQLFKDYFTKFSTSYISGIDLSKEEGEIREDIDSEVLSYIFMGMSNFIGLNHCIFKDDEERFDIIIDTFMKILDNGIFNTDIPVKPVKKITAQKEGFIFDFNIELG